MEKAEDSQRKGQIKIKRSCQRVAGFTAWRERNEIMEVWRHCAYH